MTVCHNCLCPVTHDFNVWLIRLCVIAYESAKVTKGDIHATNYDLAFAYIKGLTPREAFNDFVKHVEVLSKSKGILP